MEFETPELQWIIKGVYNESVLLSLKYLRSINLSISIKYVNLLEATVSWDYLNIV